MVSVFTTLAVSATLNTLANHGYLPRDGKDITRAQFKTAIETVFNLGSDASSALVNNIPEVISLSGLSEHNLIEHDASLAHADSFFGNDPSSLDLVLFADLIGRTKNGQLGVSQIANARKDRMKRCKAKPTGCDFGLKQRTVAFAEAAILLRGLGGKNDESISVEYATSFFVEEKFPASYKKPSSTISNANVLGTAAKIQVLAPF